MFTVGLVLALTCKSWADSIIQVYGTVRKNMGETLWATSHTELDKIEYVNQHGLSHKVNCFHLLPLYGIFVLILVNVVAHS